MLANPRILCCLSNWNFLFLQISGHFCIVSADFPYHSVESQFFVAMRSVFFLLVIINILLSDKAYLRDIAGLFPEHYNKTNITTEQVTQKFLVS